MTYYGAKELARSFRTVRDNTIKIAEEIPEEKYGFRPAEGCRSIAETLVHIAVMSRVPEQIHAEASSSGYWHSPRRARAARGADSSIASTSRDSPKRYEV